MSCRHKVRHNATEEIVSMADTDTGSSCCCGGKSKSCPLMKGIFSLALIAILTCMSMAMWKAAWAIEALAPAAG